MLHGPQDTLLAYLVEAVTPTLRTVNGGTTANYYHRLREGVKSGSWQANAVKHRLWPEDGNLPEKRVKLDTPRLQRVVKPTTDSQQTIIGFLGKRSIWDHNLATMHNGKCRTLRTELANTCQGGEPPGDTPRDQLMDAWGTPGAEENTTTPRGTTQKHGETTK